MRTEVVFGPPGTGKTTYLLEQVAHELRAGVRPERMGFFAFTRRAAKEAVDRSLQQFGLTEDDFTWFRTLHSTAYHMLGLAGKDVMSAENYAELAAATGFPFEGTYDETTERVPFDGATGDKCLACYTLARARQVSVEDTWRQLFDPGVSLAEVNYFAHSLEAYKHGWSLLDFNDFLDGVNQPLDLDVVVIDEGQDLTRQQWRFAQRIARQARRVIIAGDDDQAVFQWAGADVEFFLSLQGSLTVLPLSHRLPRAVWAVGDHLVRGIGRRRAKQFAPRDDEGAVHYVGHPEELDLADGRTHMLLARTRRQLGELVRLCRDQGVVYKADGFWSNAVHTVRAVVAYEKLRAGEVPTTSEARALERNMRGLTLPKDARGLTWDQVAWPFAGKPTWLEAPFLFGDEEKEYIRRLRRQGESLSRPGRVEVSTVHGVKGGQAQNVLIVPDITKRVSEGMRHDWDAEARVWYVASTRASETLTLVQPRSTKFFPVG